MKTNYDEIKKKKYEAENILRTVCPEAAVHRSGIYFYVREDIDGKHAYIGKAVDLCERSISHLNGYAQHIDISIKSRGFFSNINPTGWKLGVLYFPKSDLDRMERHYIEAYRKAGYHLYNVESGGTEGKTIIGERKSPKTYREGVSYGKKALAREILSIVKKHLIVSVKNKNKISEKALNKFWLLLNEEESEKNV